MTIEKLRNGISIEDYYHILAEYDCCIVETSLPGGCKGFTMKNQEDIGYVIYLNSDISSNKRIATLVHELDHIRKGDFNDSPLHFKEV